ncbi:hypothetical protein BGW41_003405 [Actinomortierella wolfii]|nr:hypothetical protein BGW41_003405 [Actinomortierella wolfii]
MARLLLVLATLLTVALVQVCAAFNLPDGVYSITLGGLYLTTEHSEPGATVFLSPGYGPRSEWVIHPSHDGRYVIFNFINGFPLGYRDLDEGSQLTLATEIITWELYKENDDIFAIRVPNSDLVIGMLPQGSYPPQVGLTVPDKGPHSCKLTLIRSDAQLADIPHGDVNIFIRQDMFLIVWYDVARVGIEDEGRAIWTIENHGPMIAIKHRDTGRYLTADGTFLRTSDSPGYFVTETTESGAVMILTAEEYDGKRRALSVLYNRVFPYFAALLPVTREADQLWHIRKVESVNDNREQSRLPCKKIRFW